MTESQKTENLSKPPKLTLREQLLMVGLMVQSVMGLIDLNMFNVAIPSIYLFRKRRFTVHLYAHVAMYNGLNFNV